MEAIGLLKRVELRATSFDVGLQWMIEGGII